MSTALRLANLATTSTTLVGKVVPSTVSSTTMLAPGKVAAASRILSSASVKCYGTISKLSPTTVLAVKQHSNAIQQQPQQQYRRTMVTVANQGEDFVKLDPYPYKDKRLNIFQFIFYFLEPTHIRMNANSKVVVVDGNLRSGKEQVAKRIAEAFGLHYLPEPRFEDLYVNPEGFDYRSLDKYMTTPKLHLCDEKLFYTDPAHPSAPIWRNKTYFIRWSQYWDALAHLFNTGQGVVLERSPASDMVFTEAWFKHGWLPKDAYDYYYRKRYASIYRLLRPHLIVYLDTDVDVIMKRIKERNIPHEVNSKVLTKEFLQSIENAYKQIYLPDAGKYSEMLLYKWNTPSDAHIDQMIEDIEHLNLDDWDIMGSKFKDWNFYQNRMWHINRWEYTVPDRKVEAHDESFTVDLTVDSVNETHDEAEHRWKVYRSILPDWGIYQDPTWTNKFKKLLYPKTYRHYNEWLARYPFF